MSEGQREKLNAAFMAVVDSYIDFQLRRHDLQLGSPIEELFLRAFILFSKAHNQLVTVVPPGSTLDQRTLDAQRLGPHEIVRPQFQVGEYRVDFRIDSNIFGRQMCVVECDGHDFHERTKQQAARDRKRDRDLQGEGYIVFRFTGSQLYRDPWGCIEEIYTALEKLSTIRHEQEKDGD